MEKPRNPVQMAVIGAAHGIRGELRVKSFTADPLALGDYGPLFDETGRLFEIEDIRPQKEVVVVRFKGVADRNAAEALAGTALYVDRSALPDTGDEEEFYHADLIGLTVRDETGALVGTVKAVHDFGGGDMLEVARATGPSVMIPFSRAAVPVVDVKGGTVTVDTIAAGLVETGEDEAARGEEDR